MLTILVGSGNNTAALPVPFLGPSLAPTAVSFNYTSLPQTELGNRTVPYWRGHVAGGSSAINYLTYNRGSHDDFDRYAQLTKDGGWSAASLKPYYFKSSRLVQPADKSNTSGYEDPTVHGYGPIQVSLSGYTSEISSRVLQTTKELPATFPFTQDYNNGTTIGTGIIQNPASSTARRSDSYTAYLEPALSRDNLYVLFETNVTRLVGTGSHHDVSTLKAVEIAADASSPRYRVSATKEVILSAGSVGTPQILQLSGVGDARVLESLGIAPVVDLPDVGRFLKDHPLLPLYWQVVDSASTFDPIMANPSLALQALEIWNVTGTDRFAGAPGSAVTFKRLPSNFSALQTYGDPSAGQSSPHYEFIWCDGFVPLNEQIPSAQSKYLSIMLAGVSIFSTGSVSLASSDPFAAPLIDPGLFTNAFDIQMMTEAVRSAAQFVASTLWSEYIVRPVDPRTTANASSADIEAYIRAKSQTLYHPVSSARMVAADAAPRVGVVDNKLKVKGVEGVRVVDASVLPDIPAGHPTGVIYTIAERAADLIKEEWGGCSNELRGDQG